MAANKASAEFVAEAVSPTEIKSFFDMVKEVAVWDALVPNTSISVGFGIIYTNELLLIIL